MSLETLADSSASASLTPLIANSITIKKGDAVLSSDVAVTVQAPDYLSMFIFSKNNTELIISLAQIPQGLIIVTVYGSDDIAITGLTKNSVDILDATNQVENEGIVEDNNKRCQFIITGVIEERELFDIAITLGNT